MKIEVLYSVHGGEEKRGREEWFVADIISLRYTEDRRQNTLSGVLRWVASEQFPASTSKVVFATTKTLRDDGGEILAWRTFSEQNDGQSEESPTSAEEEDGTRDDDFVPNEDIEEKEVASKKRRMEVRTETVHFTRRITALEEQIKGLERCVEAHDNACKARYAATASAPYNKCVPPPEPLLFLFHRLEKALVNELPRQTSAPYRGDALYKQDVLNVYVDCTLSALDTILSRMKRRIPNNASVSPSLSQIQQFIPNKVTVVFPTLLSLLTLYDDVPQCKLNGVLVRTRYSRGKDVPLLTRVIGCLEKVDDETRPCYISIGQRLPTGQEDSLLSGRVLRRENSTWDDIENYFKHPLQTVDVRNTSVASELEGLRKDRCCDLDAVESPAFTMQWDSLKTTSHNLFDVESRGSVLGTLRMKVPYLLLNGEKASKELLRVVESLQDNVDHV